MTSEAETRQRLLNNALSDWPKHGQEWSAGAVNEFIELLLAERDAQAAQIQQLQERLRAITNYQTQTGPSASLDCADAAIADLSEQLHQSRRENARLTARLRDREWQPLDTYPHDHPRAFFWIIPKTPYESYTDTSGKPIHASGTPPFRKECGWGEWGSLFKPLYWMPLPDPPEVARLRARDGA